LLPAYPCYANRRFSGYTLQIPVGPPKPGGLLVVDNAVSHQAQLQPFADLVAATPSVESVVVPVGKGELLIWKASQPLAGA
jgi:predicted O-methyltransferase YrrM